METININRLKETKNSMNIISFLFSFFFSILSFSQTSENTVFESDESMASFICVCYYSSVDADNQMEYFISNIMLKLGLDKNDKDRKKIVGNFLNNNYDKLICGDDARGNLRDKETLIKRSVGRGEYSLIDNLMLDELEYKYNLNHYDVVDGKKETILDYVEKILNDPKLLAKFDVGRLKVLHNDFIEYGAKRGSEL